MRVDTPMYILQDLCRMVFHETEHKPWLQELNKSYRRCARAFGMAALIDSSREGADVYVALRNATQELTFSMPRCRSSLRNSTKSTASRTHANTKAAVR